MCRIAKVEMARYDYETMGEFKFLKPGPDGKVRRPSIVLRIQDDEGYVGYGQAVPLPTWAYETPETVEVTLRHYLGPALIGRDPNRIDELHQLMNTVVRPGFTVGHPMQGGGTWLATTWSARWAQRIPPRRREAGCSTLSGPSTRQHGDGEAQPEEGKRKGIATTTSRWAPQDPEYEAG